MSGRFTVRELGGDPPLVEKRGDAAALAREAEALTVLAGPRWAPRVARHAAGLLVSTRMPGAPRPLAGAGPGDLERLGAVLAELHGLRPAAGGGLPWWPRPAGSLGEYRALRAADAERALEGTAHAGLARRAAAAAAVPTADGAPRMLHGDLVESNVVWGPDGPALVDWEFWRIGDPAEDLAYLVETNALPDAGLAALLRGYGPSMRERIDGWRALVAVDAGAWYLAEGAEGEARRLLGRAVRLVAGRP